MLYLIRIFNVSKWNLYVGEPSLTGLVLLPPLKNGPKTMLFGPASVENTREFGPGMEPAASLERTHEHAGIYPNSNPPRIVSDLLLFRYVIRLLADV